MQNGMAEGVGFEPTVGFPTLDFESSALNRTQPPFLEERRKRRTRLRQKLRRGKRRTPINREQASNIQPAFASCYGAAGIECNCLRDSAFSVGRWTFSVVFSASPGLPRPVWQTGFFASRGKKCYN